MSDKFEDFKGKLPDWVKSQEDFNSYKIKHTAEHVFSQAVLALWPDKVQRALAHISEDKFANDAHWENSPSEEDFEKIENKMREIINKKLDMKREEISADEAKELFKGNKYKVETIEELAKNGEVITIYRTGDEFVDLCKGPHVDNTKEIGAIKLLSIAGAYWKADEKNEMLTRVYGAAFSDKKKLEEYLWRIEEAKKRDHRKLAQELDLIVFSDLIGAGLPMYTPRGAILRNAVYNFSNELNSAIGYEEVKTPNFNRAELFKISGHYDKYKDDMLKVHSHYTEEEMFFKPMNCPQHTQIYASRLRSYKDLPVRYADFANLARDERPGEMNGIFRTRIFTQDDGHAFVREDQIEEEFRNVHKVIKQALETYGMKYWVRLSLHDPEQKEKYLGDEATWEKAESVLKDLLEKLGENYKEAPGEAAIYGPKMDFMAYDALGREWQISTIQIDMNMPARFKLKYTDKDGSDKQPIMIHRAIIGSERFIGIIIEHFGGAFPAWLSPEHVRVIPISDDNIDYAEKIQSLLKEKNIRVKIDRDSERMQNKIREAQEMKIPYMVVIGKREAAEGTISLRYRNKKENVTFKLEEFVEKLVENIKARKLEIDL